MKIYQDTDICGDSFIAKFSDMTKKSESIRSFTNLQNVYLGNSTRQSIMYILGIVLDKA